MDTPTKSYSQGEVDSLILEVRQQERESANKRSTYERASLSVDLRDKAIKYFRSLSNSGELTKEEALELYNGLAEALDWVKVDSIGGLYTVSISYQDYAIGEVEDVEADDADEACEMVSGDLYITDPEITFTVSINGNHFEASGTISTYDYDPTEELTFEATEQD